MGLQSALSTALTGLNAAETTIDVVGNNVANSNTVGFKASNAVFASQFLQTQSLGSAPTTTTGGTNPRQIGLGVKIAEITPNFTQGTIETSNSPSDLAIQGDGFFIVEGTQGEQFYTRNGQFKTNADNELVTINGQRLLGFGVDENFQIQETGLQSLSVPLGAAAVAQATENVFMTGTLPPLQGDAVSDEAGIVASAVLSDGSLEVPTDLSSSDLNAISPPDTASTTVSPNGTAGTIGAGTYRYKVTLIDADGNEGPPTPEIGPIVTTGTAGIDQSITLANLPPADGTTFVSRNIYRTDATGTGPYQFVTTLNATDPTYTDSVGDAGLPGGTLNDATLSAGNYSYYVTFYNTASGLESRPTSLVGPEPVTVAGRRIRLQNIPQPTTGDFDGVRIYRNLATDTNQFFRIAQLTGGKTSYIDGAGDASIQVPGNELNRDGPAINFALKLVDVVRLDKGTDTYNNVFREGTLSYTPEKGGRQMGTKQLTIDPNTTVQDLINFVEEASGIQEVSSDPAFPIPGNPGGNINGLSQLEFVSNLGQDNALGAGKFELIGTDGTKDVIDLGLGETQAAGGQSAFTDFLVYDSLGVGLNVRVTTVLESSSDTGTTYRWYADSSDNDPATGANVAVGTGVISFDQKGDVTAVSDATMSIDRRNVASASPLNIELDFSQLSGLNTSQASLAASRQDGFPPGVLSSFVISDTGRIRGVFSNGVTRDLGQIRMARFANNTGLEQVGENLFSAGENSGLPVEGNAGEQGIGTLTAGAVELSNTDIGQNLIKLILASTQYRGGTRVITAVQQLLDELLALRR